MKINKGPNPTREAKYRLWSALAAKTGLDLRGQAVVGFLLGWLDAHNKTGRPETPELVERGMRLALDYERTRTFMAEVDELGSLEAVWAKRELNELFGEQDTP